MRIKTKGKIFKKRVRALLPYPLTSLEDLDFLFASLPLDPMLLGLPSLLVLSALHSPFEGPLGPDKSSNTVLSVPSMLSLPLEL